VLISAPRHRVSIFALWLAVPIIIVHVAQRRRGDKFCMHYLFSKEDRKRRQKVRKEARKPEERCGRTERCKDGEGTESVCTICSLGEMELTSAMVAYRYRRA
jgi:hypothetical protein